MFEKLDELEENIKKCRACTLSKNRARVVVPSWNRGIGNEYKDNIGNESDIIEKQTKIVVIGNEPTAEEEREGVSFVGNKGLLLKLALEIIGVNSEEIYYTNLLKCRNNFLKNKENERNICLNYLRNEIILIKPTVIILMGETVAKKILGKEIDFIKLKGQMMEKRSIKYVIIDEVSKIVLNEAKKIEFLNDLKQNYNNLIG